MTENGLQSRGTWGFRIAAVVLSAAWALLMVNTIPNVVLRVVVILLGGGALGFILGMVEERNKP